MIVFQAPVIHVMQALLNVVEKNCQLHFKVLTCIKWDLCKSLCYQLLVFGPGSAENPSSWSLPKFTIKQSVLHPHINKHHPTITPLTLKDSYMLHLLEKWARPNQVDVVLLLPAMARFPISSQQRSALQRFGVRLHEVPWVRPELGPGIPRWAQEFWCVDRDFFKLHALGLDYEAVIFYDSDAGWTFFWELGGFRSGVFFGKLFFCSAMSLMRWNGLVCFWCVFVVFVLDWGRWIRFPYSVHESYHVFTFHWLENITLKATMIFDRWGSTEDVFVDPPTFDPLEECRRVLFDDFLLVLGDFCKELKCLLVVFQEFFSTFCDDIPNMPVTSPYFWRTPSCPNFEVGHSPLSLTFCWQHPHSVSAFPSMTYFSIFFLWNSHVPILLFYNFPSVFTAFYPLVMSK